MNSYKVSYEKGLGWIIELNQPDLEDRNAIVLEDYDQVVEFCDELEHAFQNSMALDWTEA